MTESLREEIMMRGAVAFHNHNRAKKYPASCRKDPGTGKTRSLTNDLLNSRLQNEEIITRLCKGQVQEENLLKVRTFEQCVISGVAGCCMTAVCGFI